MPGKIRVSALAKELEMTSQQLIAALTNMGEYVKSASSTLEAPVARRVRSHVQQMPAVKPVDRATRRDRDRTRNAGAAAALPPSGAVETTTHQVLDLARWSDAFEIMKACRTARKAAHDLVFDFGGFHRLFPSSAVPAAAAIQHYRQLGQRVSFVNVPRRVEQAHVEQPVEATAANLKGLVLGKVWVYYDDTQANALERRIVDQLERTVPMVQGVQQSLYLCLVEVIDNVLQHSDDHPGFFMCDLMTGSQRLAMAISDTGVGARNSLRKSGKYAPGTDFDALTLAIQAGVTGTGDEPRGNGLYTLQRTVECNGGSLELRSGSGLLSIRGRDRSGDSRKPALPLGPDNPGFFVDWQLDLTTPITLEDVYTDIMPVPPVNHRLEALEDDHAEHVIVVREYEEGLGTRRAAEHLRTLLVNMLTLGAPRLILDFDGVAVVGASFADEVVGKLVEQFGFIGFSQRFALRNVEPGIQLQLDRAITLRVGAQHQPAVARGPQRRRARR